MKIELDGRKYNLDKLGGAKAALRRVSELKEWVTEGGDLSLAVDEDTEELDQDTALNEITSLITLLRQKIREIKKARKVAKTETPQTPKRERQKTVKQKLSRFPPKDPKQSAIDAEIAKLMIVKIDKEAEEDAIMTLLLS